MTTPALCALTGVFHLHGFENGDQIAFCDFLAFGHCNLDDGACIGAVTASPRCCTSAGAAALARLRLLADRTGGSAAAVAERELAREGNLDATSTDLDDDVLTRQSLVLVVYGSTGAAYGSMGGLTQSVSIHLV